MATSQRASQSSCVASAANDLVRAVKPTGAAAVLVTAISIDSPLFSPIALPSKRMTGMGPDNVAANNHKPSKRALSFSKQKGNRYRQLPKRNRYALCNRRTSRTTGEIVQGAAAKWGIAADWRSTERLASCRGAEREIRAGGPPRTTRAGWRSLYWQPIAPHGYELVDRAHRRYPDRGRLRHRASI
jgi:hypothetical protein